MTSPHERSFSWQDANDTEPWYGFTLIELVVLLLVLAMLVTISIPIYKGYRDNAMNARATADIAVLQFDLSFYASANNNSLPDSLDVLGRGPILDPWGQPYQYLNYATIASGHGEQRKDRFLVPINSTYDLYSMGKDGKTKAPITAQDSRDDIIRANDGLFIGLASDF
jgi:general secretion pathway protein G